MKIRTSLRLTSTLSILLMLGSMAASIQGLRRLSQATALEDVITNLQGDIVESALLRDECLFNGSEQSLGQWRDKSGEIERHFKELSSLRLSLTASLLRDRMDRHFKTSTLLFTRMVGDRALSKRDPSLRKEAWDLAQHLMSRQFAETYLLSDSTNQMLTEVRQATRQARSTFFNILILTSFFLGLTILLSNLYLNTLVSRRISALKTWSRATSSGRFDYQIVVKGKDELAELAREANDLSRMLGQSYESLKAANRELESFSYSVSHDLRAPLRHLTGFVELLNQTDTSRLDEKSRHYLDVISHSAKKMGCLIDDLLSFSRMGRGDLMKGAVDLRRLTQEVIEEISTLKLIDWRIGDLPTVMGDRAMLRLVLVNLISNAVKFTRRVDKPIVEVGMLPDENGCHVLFVRDNGAGFDMRYVEKLFGLFHRLHYPEEFEGTGLGLANVRRIISRHGGKTWAEGAVNQGATIYFTLPLGEGVQS